jgi:hypothetical protein
VCLLSLTNTYTSDQTTPQYNQANCLHYSTSGKHPYDILRQAFIEPKAFGKEEEQLTVTTFAKEIGCISVLLPLFTGPLRKTDFFVLAFAYSSAIKNRLLAVGHETKIIFESIASRQERPIIGNSRIG